jgi:hypothetical protein
MQPHLTISTPHLTSTFELDTASHFQYLQFLHSNTRSDISGRIWQRPNPRHGRTPKRYVKIYALVEDVADCIKVGLFFQIIEKAGTIPWDKITLPEGRTRKACELMVSREKSKIKESRQAGDGSVDKNPLQTPSKKVGCHRVHLL